MSTIRIPVPVRPVLLELAVVLVTAVAVLLGVPPFDWSVPAALVACALLPLRHHPPLGMLGAFWGIAGGLAWPPAIVALYTLGRRARGMRALVPWLAAAVAVAP